MFDKNDVFVGIDTSNYTTSAAVCNAEGVVIANIKAPLPVKEGQCGLRQSDAVFAHVKNLPSVMEELSKVLDGYRPIAVAVSATPRDVEGSYMPCFLSGVSAAHAFAAQNNLPIFKTAHQNGHVMAALYSSGEMERLLSGRFLVFHLSGGTTEALIVTPDADKRNFTLELVGETDDINAGQAIDRIGVMLGLSFPAGKELEALAKAYSGKIEKKRVCVKNGRCNLSGIENIAKTLYDNGESKEMIAATAFDFICRTVIAMSEQILEKYGEMPILFAGGVMSNKIMRAELTSRFDACFAEPEYSADNAAGVALLCRLRYIKFKEQSE